MAQQAAHVADVKTRFPKTITGGTTIGDVPQDILDAAANKLFAQQVEAYKIAKARVAQYQLSVGVPESTETIVTGARVERRSWRDARCYRNSCNSCDSCT